MSNLVLKLSEPGDDEQQWHVSVCLPIRGQAPEPVNILSEAGSVWRARKLLVELAGTYPLLMRVPFDSRTSDLLLSTEQAVDLLESAERLRTQGAELMLPRAWVRPTLRVESAPYDPITRSKCGLTALSAYDWQLAIGDTVLSPEEMARLVQAKAGLVELHGRWVRADPEVVNKALLFINAHAGDNIADLIRLLRGQVRHGPPAPVEVEVKGWLAAAVDPDQPPPSLPPPPISAELRGYQQLGYEWLVLKSRAGVGAILADDMGLGKTIQVLALLATEAGPTLLVCPTSLIGNWQREAERFAPQVSIYTHHGPGRLFGAQLKQAVAEHDVTLTSYPLLARDIKALEKPDWERVVLDEAQAIKNTFSATSEAARRLRARTRLAMTGTPVENRLEEMRALFDFANPGMLGGASQFRERFAVPVELGRDPEVAEQLRAATRPFLLRRVKTDRSIIDDLPDKQEEVVTVALTTEQAALYQAVVVDMITKIRSAEGISRKGAILSALTGLKQVCNHPAQYLKDDSPLLEEGVHRSGKLAAVEAMLGELLDSGQRVLLFTQYRRFGEMVSELVRNRFGFQPPYIHGGVDRNARDRMVTEFQEPAGPAAMLLSLRAAGTGLTLTAASQVIHLDRWWNPAVENQATDRAYRIGQTRDVRVRKLVCAGTIEEKIDAMITSKAELAGLVVTAGTGWVMGLSDNDIEELLALGPVAA